MGQVPNESLGVTGDSSDEWVYITVGDRPVVALTPQVGRVDVGVVVPVLDRVIDVSAQPSAACVEIRDAIEDCGADPSAVDAAALRAATKAAERSSGWKPASDMCGLRALGGIAFPLLGAAYDLGGSPLEEVYRWAVPILRAPTVGVAARASFGSDATKPVRRALVDAIRPLPSERIDLGGLVLALMGHEVLPPDHLARVLGSERVEQEAEGLPDSAGIRLVNRVLRSWGGDERSEKLLIEAAGRPGGVHRLHSTAAYARDLGDHGPSGTLPNRLDTLHDAYRALVPSAREFPADPPQRRRRRTRTSRSAANPVPHRELPPQRDLRPVHPGTPVVVPEHITQLHRVELDRLQFVVPRTVSDLQRWGRLLSNCLGDFGPSMAAGLTTIVGVNRSNVLAYALEITPERVVRQFTARGNRRPDGPNRRATLCALVRSGTIDGNHPANAPWLTDMEHLHGTETLGS